MNNWEQALEKICALYANTNRKTDWIIVGSVGSALQGCAIVPGDIDIYVKNKESVLQFAKVLEPFSLPVKGEEKYDEHWLSSIEEPTFTQTFQSGFTWTKGRWVVDGVEVEVVHISNSAGIPDSLDGDGIWEGGKFIWDLYRNIQVGPYQVKTIPLEIQLESNLRRKREDRIQSIMKTLKTNGYDQELVKKALSKDHLHYFYEQLDIVI
ncbi:hypothetical protein HNQ94_001182 [Salirhabdus euzebyi]|uniref:Uncharacterized protein n=1 Tax=Salirhabdus euzebyi TaxID=394506 RepID=A0A841PYI5_9BACI|nr:hypothetical protein [Salirhabdus euzebyi]MBB6452736.1 hypothetical protein [Salirhabdus euzebyi]